MKNTKKTAVKSTPEVSDEETAARLRSLAANPSTPAHVLKRITRLTEVLSVEGLDSMVEDTPAMLAERYRQAAPRATSGKANKAKAELVALVERYTTADVAELDAFAHHLAEVLRIARTSELLTTRCYRDLSGAWNECVNELKAFRDASIQESEEYVRLALKMEAVREGGAGR